MKRKQRRDGLPVAFDCDHRDLSLCKHRCKNPAPLGRRLDAGQEG